MELGWGVSVHWDSGWLHRAQDPASQPCVVDRVVPESPRWLLSQGRTEEAKQLVQKAALVNGRSLSPELLNQVPVSR